MSEAPKGGDKTMMYIAAGAVAVVAAGGLAYYLFGGSDDSGASTDSGTGSTSTTASASSVTTPTKNGAAADVGSPAQNEARRRVQLYFKQFTEGCGAENCTNASCASNPAVERMENNQAAKVALETVSGQRDHELCSNLE